MKNAFLFFLAVGGVAALLYFKTPTMAPSFELATNASTNTVDECKQTSKCLVVYLAPWCGTCKSAVEVVNEMSKYFGTSSSRVGLRVVLGMDKQEALNEFAKSFTENVYFDPSGEYLRAIGGGGVPGWWVIDDSNMIQTHFAGVVQAPTLELTMKEMIDNRLRLKDLM